MPRICTINVRNGTFSSEIINTYQDYWGGVGSGAHVLWDHGKVSNPLAPDNPIILATGPMQGTNIPISGRYCVVSISPLTGGFIDSHVGGHIGPELRLTGYDVVKINDRAEEWSTVIIDGREVRVEKTPKLQGLFAGHTETRIKEKMGDNGFKVIAIGPAAENSVKFSCLTADGFRNAGRGGTGLVLASKKVKAIAIRRSDDIREDIPYGENIEEVSQDLRERSKAAKKDGWAIYKVGTSNLVEVANRNDQLPTRNFQAAELGDGWKEFGAPALFDRFMTKLRPCSRCTIRCAHILDEEFSWDEGLPVPLPEYESLALLGSNCGIHDVEILVRANFLCNNLGLDTISTGSCIAFFMECTERNLLPDQYESEGIKFGDGDGFLDLIRKIAYRQGIGDILANGTKEAAFLFGNETDRIAINVKGLEMAAWDPRGKLGLGLSYATASVGASHLRGWPATRDLPNKSAINVIDSFVEQADIKTCKDSLIICHFTHSILPALGIDDCANLFSATLNIPSDVKLTRKFANHVWRLTRKINERQWGSNVIPRERDILPARLMQDELPSGIAKGCTAFKSENDFQKCLSSVYQIRGCDDQGRVQGISL